jgi:hypothetical protein
VAVADWPIWTELAFRRLIDYSKNATDTTALSVNVLFVPLSAKAVTIEHDPVPLDAISTTLITVEELPLSVIAVTQ